MDAMQSNTDKKMDAIQSNMDAIDKKMDAMENRAIFRSN